MPNIQTTFRYWDEKINTPSNEVFRKLPFFD